MVNHYLIPAIILFGLDWLYNQNVLNLLILHVLLSIDQILSQFSEIFIIYIRCSFGFSMSKYTVRCKCYRLYIQLVLKIFVI